MKKLRAVDLFCGVGGFALGMQRAGIQIVRSMDYEPDVLEVHRANIKGERAIGLRRIPPPGLKAEPVPVPIDGKFQRGQIHKSKKVPHVADLTAVIDIAPEIALDRPDIIFGGPPCQAFAGSGKRKRDEDERSRLTEAFAILVASARPKYFVMENVKGLRTSETFRRAKAIFKASGYGITEALVKVANYGAPQGRERLIVAGCVGETDGWFSDYLHERKLARPMTVADLFGKDFGTPLRELLLPEGFDDFLPDNAKPPKHLWFRDQDQKRLLGADVDEDTRFYHATPGGGSSARLQRVDQFSPTLIRTTMHELPSTYRPLRGEPVDVRRVYQPTFEEFSQMGGFPVEWVWPDPIPKGARRNDEEMMARERRRFLMLANAVPPPLAEAIGRAVVDHHHQRVPAVSVEAQKPSQVHWSLQPKKRSRSPKEMDRYRAWLSVGKRKEPKAVIQAITDLRSAKRLLASRSLPSIKDELVAFDKLAAATRKTGSRRSQLRRALQDLADFEEYQSTVRAELFPDDDEAYANGEFHRYYGPDAVYNEVDHDPFPAPSPRFLLKLSKQGDPSSTTASDQQTPTPDMAADLDDTTQPLKPSIPAE